MFKRLKVQLGLSMVKFGEKMFSLCSAHGWNLVAKNCSEDEFVEIVSGLMKKVLGGMANVRILSPEEAAEMMGQRPQREPTIEELINGPKKPEPEFKN